MFSASASERSGRPFDAAIANPFFHQGVQVDYEVARQLLRNGPRVLRGGGRVSLAASRFLGYDELISETFGDVNSGYADGQYQVLTGVAKESSSV